VQVQSSRVLISDAPSESEARCRFTQGKSSTSSPATAPEMLASGSAPASNPGVTSDANIYIYIYVGVTSHTPRISFS
jgi:hypothetical protein